VGHNEAWREMRKWRTAHGKIRDRWKHPRGWDRPSAEWDRPSGELGQAILGVGTGHLGSWDRPSGEWDRPSGVGNLSRALMSGKYSGEKNPRRN
jgi:hypothetical protein